MRFGTLVITVGASYSNGGERYEMDRFGYRESSGRIPHENPQGRGCQRSKQVKPDLALTLLK